MLRNIGRVCRRHFGLFLLAFAFCRPGQQKLGCPLLDGLMDLGVWGWTWGQQFISLHFTFLAERDLSENILFLFMGALRNHLWIHIIRCSESLNDLRDVLQVGVLTHFIL